MSKTKIAVLGGGMGSLATAFELTEHDDSQDFEIHLYQMGWRLGGKCASSRNADFGWRNEEHGLHVLGGFYPNTFEMLERLYEAWQALDPQANRSFDDAFVDLNGATLFDKSPRLFGGYGPWRKIFVEFPPPVGAPGHNPPAVTPKRIVSEFLRWAKSYALRFVPFRDLLPESLLPLRAMSSPAALAIDERLKELETTYSAGVDRGGVGDPQREFVGLADGLIEDVKSVRGHIHDKASDPSFISELASAARGFSLFDFGDDDDDDVVGPGVHGELIDTLIMIEEAVVIARGLAADLVPLRGFDSINSEETKDWLKRHGASSRVLNSIFIEFGYHYAFSYVDGDPNRADIAAGTTMRTFARMLLTYEGAFFRHFNGGIGEVLITPFYDVLKSRGVKFRFFQQVMELQPSANGIDIERIVMRRQAVPISALGYEPIDERMGIRAWPHKPDPDSIKRAPTQSRLPDDFEDPSDIIPGEQFEDLHRGVDFDLIVLGIPASAQKQISAPLAARREEWRAMLDASSTCPTLAAQIWTDFTPEEMGWDKGRPITTGHVLPLSTWCDMSHHLRIEDRQDPYTSVSLLCGPSPVLQGQTPEEAAKEWLDSYIEDVLPKWNETVGQTGARMEMYARINDKPSDLYNFSPAGSVEHRIRCDRTGFANLFLTGDWIKNGSDLGWVEGAVISGKQCARAVTGIHIAVYGESDFG